MNKIATLLVSCFMIVVLSSSKQDKVPLKEGKKLQLCQCIPRWLSVDTLYGPDLGNCLQQVDIYYTYTDDHDVTCWQDIVSKTICHCCLPPAGPPDPE